MNNLQIIQQATETAEIVFNNGLLKQELLQREQIILKLQENINANTTKLEEKTNTAAETRERLNTTIKEAYERISKLEDNIKGLQRQHDEQGKYYDTLLENAKGKLATQVNECALKDEKIQNLYSQLDLMKKNEAKLTEKSDKIIEILQGTLDEKQKQIQENENAFKILNATIASHATEIDKIKNDNNKKIQEMEVDFKKRLEEQAAKYLKQVKAKNATTKKLRDTANEYVTILDNGVNVVDPQ